jgi:hypothetical protein
MVLLDMVRDCVCACVEELCWLFFVHIMWTKCNVRNVTHTGAMTAYWGSSEALDETRQHIASN